MRDGTLFLSALDALPRPVQARLHELLEADVPARLIAGCDNGIDQRVTSGEVRADLYYHLGRNEIAVPPLRPTGRRSRLLNDLFSRFNGQRGPMLKGISSLAEQAVRAHDWPGGGSEVRSRLLRALGSAQGPLLQPADLFPENVARGSDS